jgi:hypothetical protein
MYYYYFIENLMDKTIYIFRIMASKFAKMILSIFLVRINNKNYYKIDSF